MAKQTNINGDLSALKTVLEESGYFDTVTLESTGGVGKLTCVKNDLTFYLGDGFTDAYNGRWNVGAESAGTSYSWIANDSQLSTYNYPDTVYECSGGISIKCRIGRILITKTNNGKTAVVFPENHTNNGTDEQRSDATMGSVAAIAEGDTDSFKFFMNNCNYYTGGRRYTQTFLVPIPTHPAYGTVSYTPTAALLFCAQTRDVTSFSYNQKQYFSDGYFAIEDGEEST